MRTIIITGISDTRNNGCWAMADAAINSLKEKYSPVLFRYLTRYDSDDCIRLEREGLEFLFAPWTKIKIPKIRLIYSYACMVLILANIFLLRYFRISIFYRKFVQNLLCADFVVDLSGDSFSSDYSDYSVLCGVFPLLCRALLKRPYCFFAQSIGRFKENGLYKILFYVIKKSSFVSVREQITYDFLKNRGCPADKLFLTADIAFLLKPASPETMTALCKEAGVKDDCRYFGISVSSLISRYVKADSNNSIEDIYIQEMALLCDSVAEKYGCNILFVPHVIVRGGDDRALCHKVFNRMARKDKVVILEKDYVASELKGFISRCDMIFSSRMHASIAAVSQGIPAITIAYNHKAYGILGKMLGLGGDIVDVKEITKDDFVPHCKDLIFGILDHLDSRKSDLSRRLVCADVIGQANRNIALCEKYLR